MKIGIDARMYSTHFTGIGRYVAELIKHVALIDQDNEYYIFLNPKEFTSFTLPSPHFHKILVDAKIYSFEEQTSFTDTLLQQNLDLMHFTHFNAPLFYNKPFIVTIHDLTLTFYKGKKKTSFIERAAYNIVIRSVIKRAKHIIAISHNTKNDITRLFHVPEEKISVVYEAAGDAFKKIENEERLSQTKNKFQIDKPFILYTGVWRNHKNITGLIETFAELITTHHKDILLVITGKEDPYYPEVKELPIKLSIADRVRLVGLVSDEELIDVYTMATVFAFPSFYEGFGLPMLEAMSCGTPVVSSNASCLPEIGEEACMYFDPHSKEDMTNKLLSVLNDPALQQSLIQKGYKQVQKFSWKTMAQEILALYNKV